MVKIPQSTLGYAVNGKIVFKPTKQVNNGTTNNNWCFRTSKKSKASKKAQKEENPFQRGKIRVSHFDGVLDDLKNASMQGHHGAALKVLDDVACGYRIGRCELWYKLREWHRDKKNCGFICLVQLLFVTNFKNRSAIYLAALCGHEKTVKVYLSLYVWCRLCMLPSQYEKKKISSHSHRATFEEWMDLVGYFPVFDKNDFLLCVQSSLNLPTMDILQRYTYSLDDIYKCVTMEVGHLFLKHVPKTTVPSAVMKNKRPKLVVEDEFAVPPFCEDNETCFDYDDDGENEASASIDVDDMVRYEIDEETLHEIYSVVAVSLVYEGHGDELVSDFDMVSISSNLVDDDGHYVFPDCEEMPVLSDDRSAHCTKTGHDEWDVVSEVTSVVSLDNMSTLETNPMSYKTMLLRSCSKADTQRNTPYNNHTMKTMAKINKLDEEEEDAEFNSYFMMDGMKGTRGGKMPHRMHGKSR